MKKKPTKSELEILEVLWDKKHATVREVFELLGSRERGSYTTVLKLMQIMHDKGLVSRDESARAHIYFPRVDRAETTGGMLRDVVEKLFSGSPRLLVQQLLEDESTTDEEIRAIRDLIAEKEREQK